MRETPFTGTVDTMFNGVSAGFLEPGAEGSKKDEGGDREAHCLGAELLQPLLGKIQQVKEATTENGSKSALPC